MKKIISQIKQSKIKLIFPLAIAPIIVTPLLTTFSCAMTNYQNVLDYFYQIENHLNQGVSSFKRQQVLPSQFQDLKPLLQPLKQIDQYQIDFNNIQPNDANGYLNLDVILKDRTNNQQHQKTLRIRGFKTETTMQTESKYPQLAVEQHLNQAYFDSQLNAYVLPTIKSDFSAQAALRFNPQDLVNWWKLNENDQTSLWNYQADQLSALNLSATYSTPELLQIDDLTIPVIKFKVQLRLKSQAEAPGRYATVLVYGFNNQAQIFNLNWIEWIKKWFNPFQTNLQPDALATIKTLNDLVQVFDPQLVIANQQNLIELKPPLGISAFKITSFTINHPNEINLSITIVIDQKPISGVADFKWF